MNSRASQSSSSGCVGRSPTMPKLFGVRTIPSPKCPCQMRFTITRAGSGFAGSASHSASSRRPLPLVMRLLFAGQDHRKSLGYDFAARIRIAAEEHSLFDWFAFGDRASEWRLRRRGVLDGSSTPP